jgi:hypothetical protein
MIGREGNAMSDYDRIPRFNDDMIGRWNLAAIFVAAAIFAAVVWSTT